MTRSTIFAAIIALTLVSGSVFATGASACTWDGRGFPPDSCGYWDGRGFPEESSGYWDGRGFPEESSGYWDGRGFPEESSN